MAATVMIQIIAITNNVKVHSPHYYLPVCTGNRTSGSSVNVTNGGVVVLGYNHVGKSATLLTINTATSTSEPHHETTRQPTRNKNVLFGKTTSINRPTEKPEKETPWWKFWRWRRRRSLKTQLDNTSGSTFQQWSSRHQNLRGSRPGHRYHRLRGERRLSKYRSGPDLQQKSELFKIGPSERRHFEASPKPQSKISFEIKSHISQQQTSATTYIGAETSQSLIKLRARRYSNVHSGLQGSLDAIVGGEKPTSWIKSDFSEADLSSLSRDDLTPSSLRTKRSSLTQTDGRSSCSCKITATSDIYLKMKPVVLPQRMEHEATVWLTAGNVSEKLSVSQHDMQFHVFLNTSLNGESNGRKLEEGSSVDGEDTVISVNVFITTSNTSTSFMVALAVMSQGDINVSCSAAQETKNKDTWQGGDTKTNWNERHFSQELGSRTMAGELIGGIVLIVLAVLIIGAVILWSRYYQAPGIRRRNKSVVKEGEAFPMKELSFPMTELSNYEEMEDSETGYYRYSDPLDHRTTVMTSSQLALDRAHIILHHPQLGPATAASVAPQPSSMAAKGIPKTPTSAVSGMSRYLAELALDSARTEEDAVSDVYEEYSSVMVQEEQQEKSDKAEAIGKLLENQRSDPGEQPSDVTKQKDQLLQPVVIRVHRKESDTKRPNNTSIKNSPCHPLTSTHQRKPSEDYVGLSCPQDKLTELHSSNLDKSNSELEEITEYMNTQDLHTIRDHMPTKPLEPHDQVYGNFNFKGQTGEAASSLPDIPTSKPVNIEQDTVRDIKDTREDVRLGGTDHNGQFDLTDSASHHDVPSAKVCVSEQLELKNCLDASTYCLPQSQSLPHDHLDLDTYGLGSATPLVDGNTQFNTDPTLETYGLASAKPLVGERSVSVCTSECGPETYGLTSRKSLVTGQTKSDDKHELDTYGLASAKPLVPNRSATVIETGLETYGLSSARPLEHIQLIDEFGLETYGLASANPVGTEHPEPMSDLRFNTDTLAPGQENQDIDNIYSHLNERPTNAEFSQVARKKNQTESNLPVQIISVGQKVNGLSEDSSARKPATNQPTTVASPTDVLDKVDHNDVYANVGGAEVPRPGSWEGLGYAPSTTGTPGSACHGPTRQVSRYETPIENLFGNVGTRSEEAGSGQVDPVPLESELRPDQRDKTHEEADVIGGEYEYESYSQLKDEHPDIFISRENKVDVDNNARRSPDVSTSTIVTGTSHTGSLRETVAGADSSTAASYVYADMEENWLS